MPVMPVSPVCPSISRPSLMLPLCGRTEITVEVGWAVCQPVLEGRRPQATSHSSPIPLFRHKAVADCSANGHCLYTLTRLIIPKFCTTCRSVIMVQPAANCSPSEGQVSWPSCRSVLPSSFPQRGRRKRERSEQVGEEDDEVVIEFSTIALEKKEREKNPAALGFPPSKEQITRCLG